MTQSLIHLEATNFTGAFSWVNTQPGTVAPYDVTYLELLAASITLGFQSAHDTFNAGPMMWLHRLGLGFSATSFLEKARSGWRLSEKYRRLDPSEKAFMSYWQGMIFAKVAAARRLNVPWLVNVDHMREFGLLQISGASGQRGDLVGRDRHGRFHVVEAKGRSRRVGEELVAAAKQQASAVTSVCGQPPATASACISRLWKTPVEILLDDPPSRNDDNIKLEFEKEAFWEYYYGSIVNYIRTSPDLQPDDDPVHGIGPPEYRWALVNWSLFHPLSNHLIPTKREQHIWIGLPEKLMRNASTAETHSVAQKDLGRNHESRGWFLGGDHVALKYTNKE